MSDDVSGTVISGMVIFYEADVTGLSKVIDMHRPHQCEGQICVVHNPVDGPWRKLPMAWRTSHKFFERRCEHDIYHPDPSQLPFWYATGQEGLIYHGCDRCCQGWASYVYSRVLEA